MNVNNQLDNMWEDNYNQINGERLFFKWQKDEKGKLVRRWQEAKEKDNSNNED